MASTTTDETSEAAAEEPVGPKILNLKIWPHRSLSPAGFRWLMIATTLGVAIPLFALFGTSAFWVVGAFILADLLLLYGLMKLSYRDAKVLETVELWPDRLRITRTEPSGELKVFEANPHWVRVELHSTRAVEGYLVVSASGRDVELGAFLTPQERRELAATLRQGLNDAAKAVALGL